MVICQPGGEKRRFGGGRRFEGEAGDYLVSVPDLLPKGGGGI